MRILVGLALIAHALIHSGYLSPAPPQTAGGPAWPFEMSKSWLVSNLGLHPDVVRPLGAALVAVTILAFVAAGLATIGIGVPQEWWRWLIAVGAIASLLTLALFFHPWIILGLVIDVALLYLVFVAGWHPFGAAGAAT
jgi:hypothetical protein